MLMTKEEAKIKLEETDWSVLSDVNLTTASKAEFINYRFCLRQVIISGFDSLNMEFPEKPSPTWQNE